MKALVSQFSKLLWNDLPVVAYDAGAVGEVLGTGGILLKEKTPALVAAAVHRAVSDSVVRSCPYRCRSASV